MNWISLYELYQPIHNPFLCHSSLMLNAHTQTHTHTHVAVQRLGVWRCVCGCHDPRLEHMSAQHTKFKSLLQRFYLHTVHTTTTTRAHTHTEQLSSSFYQIIIIIINPIYIHTISYARASTHSHTPETMPNTKANGISSRYETMNRRKKKLFSLTHAHAKQRRRRRNKIQTKNRLNVYDLWYGLVLYAMHDAQI